MRTFAFLFHPTSMRQVRHFWPITSILPANTIASYLIKKSFKVIHLKRMRSGTGAEIQGYLIACPMIPEQIFETDDETILDKIVSAGYLAHKLGCQILGIAGYFAHVADKKPMIYKHVKTAITSGSTFTAWSIFESVYRSAQEKNMDLKKSVLTVFGPNNAVGQLSCRKLADYLGTVILTGGVTDRLDRLKAALQKETPATVEVEPDTPKAIKQADIILNTYNGPTVLFNLEDVKPDAIICDAAVFKHVAERARQRNDLTVIDCGIVRLPQGQRCGTYQGLPDNTVCSYMTEAMLLTFEDKFVNFSLGENINLDKMEDIADIAARHGFEICVPG